MPIRLVVLTGDALEADVKAGKTFFRDSKTAKKTGTMPTKAIVAANDLYEEGYHAGNPGGLDAIETDLAIGNVKEAVDIFGKVGTFAGGPPVHDAQGSDVCSDAWGAGIGNVGEQKVVFAGQSSSAFFSTSVVAAQATVVHGVGAGASTGSVYEDTQKVELWIDGVKVAETRYMYYSESWVLVGNISVASGSRSIQIKAHNYHTSSQDFEMAGGVGGGCSKI